MAKDLLTGVERSDPQRRCCPRAHAGVPLADRLSCSVSEVDRQITIFTLAATPLACSAVMHSKHPDGQQP
jgi:hypothetical protein